MRKVLYILGELTDDDIQWMLANSRRQNLHAGEVLIEEGGTVDALYIVLDGTLLVSLQTHNHTHDNGEIARLSAGEMVGEMSFLEERPPAATVRAGQDALVLAIPRTRLAEKLKQDSAFAARFYRALAVFLSYRLRSMDRLLGYGGDSQPPVPAGDDELDENLLDNVYQAGTRFEQMLKRLKT